MRRSAAIPYRRNEAGEVEVLLVTTRKRKRWVLPKGKAPRGMPPFASAAREAREEGGVIGDVDHAPIGFNRVRQSLPGSAALEARVAAYALAVWTELDVWPEMRLHRRRWMSLRKAIKNSKDRGVRDVLRTFGSVVEAERLRD